MAMLKPADQAQILFKTALRFAGEKQYDKSIGLFQEILAITPGNPLIYYNISCLYAIQNRKAEAVEWLRQAVDHGYENWDKMKTDKDLENIKNEPMYRNLLQKNIK